MGRTGTGVENRGTSIRVQFMYNGSVNRRTVVVNGKPIAPTPANIKYAVRLVAEIRDKVRLGVFVMSEYFPVDGASSATGTVGDQLDVWFAGLRVEHSTRDRLKSVIRFWKHADCGRGRLGAMPVLQLRTSHLRTALATRPDWSGKTVNNHVSVIREALETAVDDQVITANPAAKLKRAAHQKQPADPFTAGEREAIIAGASRRCAAPVANMIEFWMWSGLRTSEIFALAWSSVSLQRGVVTIAEAWVDGELKDTKTHVVRDVQLNSRSRAALMRQREYTQLQRGLVFPDHTTGLAWASDEPFRLRHWKPLLASLGIRYRRPYNMRHTYATTMLMAGMKPAFCARQMGHSVMVFFSHYAKWIDADDGGREMDRLEQSIIPGVSQEISRGGPT